jgi:sulfur dioxygenase
MLHQLGVEPVYGMNTHVHADHVTATGELRKQHFPSMRTVISKRSHARADRLVDHGELLHVGGKTLEVRATPGHTNGWLFILLIVSA